MGHFFSSIVVGIPDYIESGGLTLEYVIGRVFSSIAGERIHVEPKFLFFLGNLSVSIANLPISMFQSTGKTQYPELDPETWTNKKKPVTSGSTTAGFLINFPHLHSVTFSRNIFLIE